jgi:hypothetical protein
MFQAKLRQAQQSYGRHSEVTAGTTKLRQAQQSYGRHSKVTAGSAKFRQAQRSYGRHSEVTAGTAKLRQAQQSYGTIAVEHSIILAHAVTCVLKQRLALYERAGVYRIACDGVNPLRTKCICYI